jgi:molybdate transport system substrate-binding protein
LSVARSNLFAVRALAIVAILFAVTGCGKGSGSQRAASTQASAEKAAPQELNIAAAADLQFALADISNQFRLDHPEIDVKITYGSSGNFYSQISNQAPFDLFFSADALYPKKLAEQGLTVKGSEFTYGIGKIVLWVPKDSKLDVTKLGMKALLDPSIRRIAIANPQHAPYGRAAESALKAEQLWDPLQSKVVLGADIAQTAEFVQSGAADAGIIALSLALSPRMKDAGSYFLVPAKDYPTISQVGVILAYSRNRDTADVFKQFVVGEQGRAILKQYGFGLPDETK